MHDFVLFDGGVKKLPRVHSIRHQSRAGARQASPERHHLAHPGHGKSIIMVLLARWILDNPNARAIITDRDELDKQIERIFTETGEAIYRTSSGRDDAPARPGQPAPVARSSTSSAGGM